MTLPQIMSKVWTGSGSEFFTHRDMVRVERNLNILAEEVGVEPSEYREISRSSQFYFDDANRLESLMKTVASKVGVQVQSDTSWNYGRTLSYVDFERWEAGTWKVYKALGGFGDRIPSDRILVNYHTTLFSSAWRGDGPYHVDVLMPAVDADTEAMAFVTHTASILQRQSEYNALLRTTVLDGNIVRFEALGLRPAENIPVTMAIGGLQMNQQLDLKASGWVGPDSGPWTQQVTVPQNAVEAVIGQWEGMSSEAILQMASARLHVSSISGNTVTVRVIGKKPTADLNPMLLYDIAETEAE